MCSAKVLIFTVLLAAVASIGRCAPNTRIVDGQDVDTMQQFPHQVNIVPTNSDRNCGGSVLNAKWVLTSANCVKGYSRVELQFNKQSRSDFSANYYGISVSSAYIHLYPTNYDDLALIEMPVELVFSETIQPINISSLSIQALESKFAVLPGFSDGQYNTVVASKENEDNLKYGMFKVLNSNDCKTYYGSGFNQYNQLCVGSWGSNPNVPCDSDLGNGLVIGWPASNEVIGLFSTNSLGCKAGYPSIFTYVAKYLPWIKSMIGE